MEQKNQPINQNITSNNQEENITASNIKNIAPSRMEISEEVYQKLANLQQKKEDERENDDVKVLENKKKIRELLIQQERTIESLRVESLRIYEEERALELATARKAVSTIQGKEIIQAKISQELVEVKATFENLKISEVSSEEIRNKLTEKLERVEEIAAREINLGDYIISNFPLAGNLVPGNVAGNVAKKFKNEMLKEGEKMVKKQVEKATVDLERQRKKAVKKIDTLIKVRDKEVKGAQEVIFKMESVIEKLNQQLQNNKELSDKKINELQGAIKELTGELKKLGENEAKYENWLKEKSARNMKNRKETEAPKVGIIDKDTEIAKLKETIEDLKMEAAFFEDSRDQQKLKLENVQRQAKGNLEKAEMELKHEKGQHELTKTTWQETYNRSEARRKHAEEELSKYMKERAEEEEREIDLEVKNKQLKRDKEELKKKEGDLEKKIRELEEKAKALEPSWIYTMCEKAGLVSLKNTAVNGVLIVGLIGVVYFGTLILKYLVKPTFLNLKSFIPKSKPPKKIVEVDDDESEEEEEEENILEVKEVKEPKKLQVRRTKKNKGIG